MARKRPWWSGQRWMVKAVAVRDASDGRFKAGDWIEIYTAGTKKEAQRLAEEWGTKMHTPTMVEPGVGHPSRRGT